jgi:uncharacterized protein YndB with AHSA1/START domain
MTLPHRLDRSVLIRASRDTVFRFFTDPARWASWWGKGSTIEATPGGRMLICYPGGVQAAGEVVEVAAPERIVFTYGFVGGKPIAPGSSRVTIRLAVEGDGTRLSLAHEFAEPAVRDEHVQGWRYQLALFSNLVANEVHAGATAVVDGWFDAWAETDATARERLLARIAAPEVRFRDQYGMTDGVSDLMPQIAAAQKFMPGMTARRAGEVRHCQGTVLCDWRVTMPDGQQKAAGTNVFTLGPDGRIESVTGFWGLPKQT